MIRETILTYIQSACFLTTLKMNKCQCVYLLKKRVWPVTGLWNKGPLKILNGIKLILDDQGNHLDSRTTDTQWRHKLKISEKLGRCGRQNILRPYLKIWEWEWIFGRAVKAISSLGVRSPWFDALAFQTF